MAFGHSLLVPRRLQAKGRQYPAGWISDIKPPALPGCANFNRLSPQVVNGQHGLSLGMLKIGDLDPFVVEDLFVVVHQVKVAAHNSPWRWGVEFLLLSNSFEAGLSVDTQPTSGQGERSGISGALDREQGSPPEAVFDQTGGGEPRRAGKRGADA